MTDDKQRISTVVFYDLRNKLWVEAMAAALNRPSGYGGPAEMTSIPTCAQIADAAVEEFDKRFRPV